MALHPPISPIATPSTGKRRRIVHVAVGGLLLGCFGCWTLLQSTTSSSSRVNHRQVVPNDVGGSGSSTISNHPRIVPTYPIRKQGDGVYPGQQQQALTSLTVEYQTTAATKGQQQEDQPAWPSFTLMSQRWKNFLLQSLPTQQSVRHRFLTDADKWHPDKEDASCEYYQQQGRSGNGYTGGGGGDDDSNDKYDEDENDEGLISTLNFYLEQIGINIQTHESRPPCRGTAPPASSSNNSTTVDAAGETESTTASPTAGPTESMIDPLPSTTPPPLAANATSSLTSSNNSTQESINDNNSTQGSSSNTPAPAPVDESTTVSQRPQPAPLSPSPTTVATTTTTTPPTATTIVLTPPPIMNDNYEDYDDSDDDDSDDEQSYAGNIARVSISVALPPHFEQGIPEPVTRAVTKVLNISSALRSDEMLNVLLTEYTGANSNKLAETVGQLMDLFVPVELPAVVPPTQSLWFHKKYQPPKLPDSAFFWELIFKDTHARSLGRRPVVSTTVNNNNNNDDTTTTLPLATWWRHTVAYRCYIRDEYGLVSSLSDPDTVALIEEQMHLWISYHINYTYFILDKLHLHNVAGLAMPGDEYDRPFNASDFDSTHITGGGSGDSYSGDNSRDPPSHHEDDNDDKDGTFTEPLYVGGEGLETANELIGLAVLCTTVVVAMVWTLLARSRQLKREEEALWGSNVGTEKALEDVLNIGWRVHDEMHTSPDGHNGPRQVMEIYDRTKQGMGYRDDDSILYGGAGAHCY